MFAKLRLLTSGSIDAKPRLQQEWDWVALKMQQNPVFAAFALLDNKAK